MNNLTESAKSLLEQAEIEAFLQKIEKTISKHFPKSAVDVSISNNLGRVIWISFALGKDKSEYPMGIVNNDPVKVGFVMHDAFDRDENLVDELVLEKRSSAIKVNPPEGSYLAMTSHKVPFRKVKGNKDKIIKGLDRYFKKLKDEIKKVKDDIYGVDRLPYRIEDKL